MWTRVVKQVEAVLDGEAMRGTDTYAQILMFSIMDYWKGAV